MLGDGFLAAELSVIQQMKWSRDLQNSILALSRLDGRLERPDPISRLVISNPSTKYDCPDSILQIALVANKYPTLILS